MTKNDSSGIGVKILEVIALASALGCAQVPYRGASDGVGPDDAGAACALVCDGATPEPVGAPCGDGVHDSDERCDDGNADEHDGCGSDCTFACTTDTDCDDGSVCTGVERCDPDRHACVAGPPLDCHDGDACTLDFCDPSEGCRNALIDEDGDGFAAVELGACGLDCDDHDVSVFPGRPEKPGDGVDSNCDGAELCFLDADDDGYVGPGFELVLSSDVDCDDPLEAYAGAPGGDCAPDDATVHPDALEVPGDGADADCDGRD